MSEEPRDDDAWEEVDADDAIVGKAFRISMIVLGAAAVVAVALVLFLTREEEAPPPVEVAVETPQAVVEEATPPRVRFTDVTAAAGIDFVHENGARGQKLLPETMGGGAAFHDYDRDGDPDLLLVNSAPWPGSDAPDGAATMRLYANDGAGAFTDVTGETGLGASFYGMGAAWGDADCDGDADVFFTALGPNHLFLQDEGRFREEERGVAGEAEAWSTCAAFFDADLDGDLDLFVGNYVRWSREIDARMDYQLTGVGRAYGPPMNYQGAHPYFYRNAGDGGFAEVSEEAGLRVANAVTGAPMAKTLGVRPTDVDLDGDLDLVVANDTVQNCLFLNRGDGTFDERGAQCGIAYDRDGRATGAMGVDAARYRGDGSLGVAVANFANEMSSLYVSQGRTDLFLDESIGAGLGAPSRKVLSFGVAFLDYDLDGRLDLLQSNGHLEPEITQVQASQRYEQPPQLFWNAGADARRTFVEVDEASAGDLARPIVGRGLTFADVDLDGDPDVLLTQTGRRAVLLRNDQDLGHAWIRLRLEGAGCNRGAIGARIELEDCGGRVQVREVVPTRSYLSQVELPLAFGLGSCERVERVTVRWPDGETSEHTGLETNREHTLRR